MDCGRGHPIFKKMLTLHNHKTATQTHSLCGVVLFDADALLEKVVASTPCSVACMAHMLHHCRGRVLGSPRASQLPRQPSHFRTVAGDVSLPVATATTTTTSYCMLLILKMNVMHALSPCDRALCGQADTDKNVPEPHNLYQMCSNRPGHGASPSATLSPTTSPISC